MHAVKTHNAQTIRSVFIVLAELAVITACHILAMWHIAGMQFPFADRYLWPLQCWIFVAALFVLSIAGSFPASIAVMLGVLAVRLCLLHMIGVPLGGDLVAEQFLVFPLLLTAGMRFQAPLSIISSSVILVSIIFSNVSVQTMGVVVDAPSGEAITGVLLNTAIVALLSCLLGSVQEERRRREDFIKRLENAVSNLTRTNIGYQDFTIAVEDRSRQAERKRISREIHDVVGYTITNILMMMKSGLRMVPSSAGELKDLLEQVIAIARSGMADIRNSLYSLQTEELYNHKGINAIQRLVNYFHESTGVEVVVEYGNIPASFGPKLDLCFYRMVQEGLTNAFRHGEAGFVRIVFWMTETTITISIYNDGRPAEEIRHGIGLLGMEERIKSFGGTMVISNRKDGFEIVAVIPREQPA
jgi:signal transduction histidine kinase